MLFHTSSPFMIATTFASQSVSHTTKSVRFYPLQSCSTVCGVVVIVMTALLCQHEEILLKSKQLGSVGWLSTPSKHSDCVRMAIMDWILLEMFNIELLGLGSILRIRLCRKRTYTGVERRLGRPFSDNLKITQVARVRRK